MEQVATKITQDDFPCMTYEHNGTILSVAPTWVMNDKETFEKFLPDFQKNYHQAARDYGCEATRSEESYFRNPEILEVRANRNREHPVHASGVFKEFFKPKNEIYFLHADFSARHDATGIAMSHYDYRTDKIVVDLMLRIAVPSHGEIYLSRSREIILDIQRRGFFLKKVTFDTWQSLETLQKLQSLGINAEFFSVDKDTKAYDTLMELISDDKLDYYYYQPFITEAKMLRLIKGKKVDHPATGSKDVSDAVAGCVYQTMIQKPIRKVGLRSI